MQGRIGCRAVPWSFAGQAFAAGARVARHPFFSARLCALLIALPLLAGGNAFAQDPEAEESGAPRLQFASALKMDALALQSSDSIVQSGEEASLMPPAPSTATTSTPASEAARNEGEPTLRLGTGDAVTVQIYGRPEFNTTAYVSEDQTISVPLAGAVKVGGKSPADAARAVAQALKDGQFLVDPQVSITFSQFRSQQVSVLGEVHTPGRFPIESKTSVLDMLAQAGGINETGADMIVLIRPTSDGQSQRIPIDIKKLTSGEPGSFAVMLKGGDSLFVPRAEQYYVYGEVQQPNMYRLESGTTVVQAITRSGGLTPRGSERRIEIKRKVADGKYKTFDADLGDSVQPNDVIRVKERLF